MRLAYGDGNGIVIVDTAGKKVRRLSRSPEDWSDGEPSWSPDAKRIAFARTSVSNPGGVDLYTVRASRGKPTRLLYGGFAPSWSPRGGALLVTRTDGHDLWPAIVDPEGRKREVRLAHAGSWSPHGQVTFASGGDLTIADALGRHAKRVWHGIATAAAWSSDEARIAFIGVRGVQAGLWVVDADGSKPKLIVPAHHLSAPAWSPDGRQIAFSAKRLGHFTIELVQPDGRGHRIVERNDGTGPIWSPDGRWLAYTGALAQFTLRVYLVQPDGRHLRELPGVDRFAPGLAWEPCTR